MKLWVPTQNEKQKSPTTYSLCTEIVGTRLSCAVTARLSPRASSTSTEKSPGTRFYDTPMLYLTIALLIVAAIAAGYAVKQTNIAKAMQEKHDDVCVRVARLSPSARLEGVTIFEFETRRAIFHRSRSHCIQTTLVKRLPCCGDLCSGLPRNRIKVLLGSGRTEEEGCGVWKLLHRPRLSLK